MIDKLNDLDRRWIFLAITIAVVLPLIFPFNLPIQISEQTKKFYNFIEHLPEDSLVCVSFDYGPGTRVECHPMAQATLRHLFRRKCKVVAVALWPEGAMFAREALSEIGAKFNLKEGIDYVNLGYKAGGEVILRGAGENLNKVFAGDIGGHRWENIPLLKRVKGWNSFDMICTWSMGNPGLTDYVRVVGSVYRVPIVTGMTAVTAPGAIPLVNSNQVKGLIQGMRGASEYERMLGYSGSASKGMDALSMAHFMIATFIVMANAIYYLKRRRQRGGKF